MQLGATEAYQLGLGDDQSANGYLQMFDSWCTGLQDSLISAGAIKSDIMSSLQSYIVERRERADSDIGQYFQAPIGSESPGYTAMVVENKLLTAFTWAREVRHIRLQILGEPSLLSYYPGDIAAVQPENNDALIRRLFRILKHYEGDEFFRIRRSSLHRESRVADYHGSIENLFKYVLDIAGIPQRSFFKAIAPYATEEDERQKLFELSDAAGTDLYFEYCIREKRNFVDVLEDFRSTHGIIYS